MNSFLGIRFKREAAKRFQEFSKTHFSSHTEAMTAMLDFFYYNEISPKEHLGPTVRTLEATLKKRINAIIAILKDMEKTQTKPTAVMLELLFRSDEIAQAGQDAKPAKKPVRFKEKRQINNKL